MRLQRPDSMRKSNAIYKPDCWISQPKLLENEGEFYFSITVNAKMQKMQFCGLDNGKEMDIIGYYCSFQIQQPNMPTASKTASADPQRNSGNIKKILLKLPREVNARAC